MVIFDQMIRSDGMSLVLLQLVPILDQIGLVDLDVIDLGSVKSPGSQNQITEAGGGGGISPQNQHLTRRISVRPGEALQQFSRLASFVGRQLEGRSGNDADLPLAILFGEGGSESEPTKLQGQSEGEITWLRTETGAT